MSLKQLVVSYILFWRVDNVFQSSSSFGDSHVVFLSNSLKLYFFLFVRSFVRSYFLVTVTRLIRIRYGDYTLQTIPPGMAIEVPYKPIHRQKARGAVVGEASSSSTTMETRRRRRQEENEEEERASGSTVKWYRSVQ